MGAYKHENMYTYAAVPGILCSKFCEGNYRAN